MPMTFQSLKFKIAGNLAVIILLSVVLSDFLIVNIIQKSLMQERISQGKAVLTSLTDYLNEHLASGSSFSAERMLPLVNESSIVYLSIHLKDTSNYRFGEVSGELKKELIEIADRSLKSGVSQIEFLGDTLGVFWHQKKYVAIFEPSVGDNVDGSVVNLMVLQLDSVYQALRQSQKIIVLYVIANFVILLLFGVYRLSRLIIRPIHRFIKMTDDFREKDRLYFTHGKNYQEFSQLSKALNHMMDVIETDKQNLRHSLQELESANNELKTAQHEMVKAEKLASVGRLSAGIAHEIGNPIGIVLGYLDLLRSRPNLKNDDIGQDFLKRAQDEISRINSVIRQLLDFSRSSSVDSRIVPMHDLVRNVAAMMSEQPLMSDIKIECRLENVSDTVNIDSNQIRQVLINLMINAADSIKSSEMQRSGSIRIFSSLLPEHDPSALHGQPTFLLKVIDNGSGISSEDIDYIFDPFFTTKEPGKGTGLGLSVSYMIIEQAGGRITAESAIGQGTTMTIYLPLHPNP